MNKKVDEAIAQITQEFCKNTQSWAAIAAPRDTEDESPTTFNTPEVKTMFKEAMSETDREKESERKEREKRANNIIIFRAAEPETTTKKEQEKEDEELVKKFLEEIGVTGVTPEKIVRLGEKRTDTKRPLRFTVGNSTQKAAVMDNLTQLRNATEPLRSIVISHDLTPLQRTEKKSLHDKASENVPEGFRIVVTSEPGPLWDPKVVKLKLRKQTQNQAQT